MRRLLALFTVLVAVDGTCQGIRRGYVCRKDCCSDEEEASLLDAATGRFHEKTTEDILDKLNHGHPEQFFFDLFYPDTPRYAVPPNIEAAAKKGSFSSEVMDFELTRKMGSNSFTSDLCKRTNVIADFIRATELKMGKSHAIYQAFVIADEIKKEILDFPLSDQCFEHVLFNGLFNTYSCNACGTEGVFPRMRTCTNLCENIVNGCYYVLTRVFAHDHNLFKESLVNLLKERAREERALLRNEISLYVTDQDIADGVACTGLPEYEVEYRLERLLAVPKLGRDYTLSRPFRMLLRSPEVLVPEFVPIQPNALNFCRHKGHLDGNTHCFNGHSLGSYPEEISPLTSAGQEKNRFKSFGGNAEHYAKLTIILDRMEQITNEMRYQGSV